MSQLRRLAVQVQHQSGSGAEQPIEAKISASFVAVEAGVLVVLSTLSHPGPSQRVQSRRPEGPPSHIVSRYRRCKGKGPLWLGRAEREAPG